MADVTIVKLLIRRGTDEQRTTTVFDQGEPAWTLDTKRLFVGDGATAGGHVVGTKFHGPFNTDASLGNTVGLQIQDLAYANSKLYAVSSTNYEVNSGFAYIGPNPGATLDFGASNTLVVRQSSLDTSLFSATIFGPAVRKAGNQFGVDFNTNSLELSSSAYSSANALSIKQNSIGAREIASAALSSGLIGGNNNVIAITASDQFVFTQGGVLELANPGTEAIPVSSIKTGDIGPGLKIADNKLEGLIQEVDNTSLTVSNSGLLSLINGFSGAAGEWPYLNVNNGRIDGVNSTVFDVVTATGLSGNIAGNEVPIGTILPHARAFTVIPEGYLLCDGNIYSSSIDSDYRELYDVIGNRYDTTNGYPSPPGNFFRVPALTGGNVLLYGADGGAPDSTTYYISGATDAAGGFNDTGSLSAQGFNFLIRYSSTAGSNDLFNGAPNQVSRRYQGALDQTSYNAIDSTGQNIQLSSAGFVTFALSGNARNSDEPFDRFAIPVFSW